MTRELNVFHHIRQFVNEMADGYGPSNFLDFGAEEQRGHALRAMLRFDERVGLRPHVESLNLFGFAEGETCFATADDMFFRLVPVARQLGMTERQAHEWAREEWRDAVVDQRLRDEKRGTLGWECLNQHVDLDLHLVVDDETAQPDANGRRWSFGGEWLISVDRIPSLLLHSPWAAEFMANTEPLMRHAAKASGLIEGLFELERLFEPDTYSTTDEEARRLAQRGPVVPTDQEGEGR